MENLVTSFQGKRVLVTGHTGFKGAWLTLWLARLGAEVHGFSLAEDPSPATYSALGGSSLVESEKIADLDSFETFKAYYDQTRPELVFHLAAQPLVRRSYEAPLATLTTNFMGTAHVLESIRVSNRKTACVVVTSDKCYQNSDIDTAYAETDAMGGRDVYSMSKGACELLVAAYRSSFFSDNNVALATARAGNVVGGGDYAENRIVPDCVRSLAAGRKIQVRNPGSTRPWQHVLEPLSGYLVLAQKLLSENPAPYCQGWNFGPFPDKSVTVREFVESLIATWGSGGWEEMVENNPSPEARFLRLNIEKAAASLNWKPTWSTAQTIGKTVEWYKTFERGAKRPGSMRQLSLEQIKEFEENACQLVNR